MARARFRRLCKVVGLVKSRPKSFVNVEFLDVVVMCISRIADHKIHVIARRWMN